MYKQLTKTNPAGINMPFLSFSNTMPKKTKKRGRGEGFNPKNSIKNRQINSTCHIYRKKNNQTKQTKKNTQWKWEGGEKEEREDKERCPYRTVHSHRPRSMFWGRRRKLELILGVDKRNPSSACWSS